VEQSGSAESINAVYLFVVVVVVVVAVIARGALSPRGNPRALSFCENAQNPSMPFTYLSLIPLLLKRGVGEADGVFKMLFSSLSWSFILLNRI
jgi:hypothetical protein